MGRDGHCPSCPWVEIGGMAGIWQNITPEVSAEFLRNIERSVLRVIAEIPEAASREYPEAKHRRSAGVRAITHLLLRTTVTHHDVRTTVCRGTAAVSDTEVQAKPRTLPSPHSAWTDHTALKPYPGPPQTQRFLELGRGRECQEFTSHKLFRSFPTKIGEKGPFEIQ